MYHALLGDVDLNGAVNILDVATLLNMLAGM